MYVQVVTYSLGMSEREYLDVANEVAPRFSGMSGLQAKIWLEDPDQGRYGAVYLWEDRDSMERFLRSDLFEGTNPDFVDVQSEGFDILENLTAQTQPVLELVQGRRPAAARGAPAIAKAAAPQKAPTGRGSAKKAPAKKATAPKKVSKKSGG
ncbi:MAG TPA: YdhR family protein [Acidimicrobiales bacterium]|nr:YdhR family protein [Acidimicrobiales bacterium]